MMGMTPPDKDLILALARLLEAAKGTAAEYGVAYFIECLCDPPSRHKAKVEKPKVVA